jgi:phosphate transport system protein
MMEETRKTYHQELDGIRAEVLALAQKVTEMIPHGTDVLLLGDLTAADDLIGINDEVEQTALALEERCYELLALQAPVAGDLRVIVASTKILAEVDRSAGLVVNISKAARRLYGMHIDPRLTAILANMSRQAHQLFRFSTEAFADADAPLAAALDDIDDNLDRLQVDLIQAIFECHADGRVDLPVAVQLALVCRFYERIGDHAVNIGERVRYMVTGWMPERDGALRSPSPSADVS